MVNAVELQRNQRPLGKIGSGDDGFDTLRCTRVFEILWAENHSGSELLKERETEAKRF